MDLSYNRITDLKVLRTEITTSITQSVPNYLFLNFDVEYSFENYMYTGIFIHIQSCIAFRLS